MRERGSTIIEVIVAITVFAVVMLCSMSLFSFGNDIVRRAQEQTCALQIAKNELSWCKLKCISSCPPYQDPTQQPVIRYYVIPELNVTYCAEMGWIQAGSDFGTPVNTYNDWYKVVTVTVTWNSTIDAAAPRSVSLNTMATTAPHHY